MKISDKNNLPKKNKQFEIFGSTTDISIDLSISNNLKQTSEDIIIWHKKIFNYQNKILKKFSKETFQESILMQEDKDDYQRINPFLLSSISLNFWRTNQPVHNGPAMYFVVDKMKNSPIILYIGETNCANKRWKGEHDCKNYLKNYKESLSKNSLETHSDIRFFLDVPKEVRLRRKLEKTLIYLWLPPFNKETRSRWSTTFTNN